LGKNESAATVANEAINGRSKLTIATLMRVANGQRNSKRVALLSVPLVRVIF